MPISVDNFYFASIFKYYLLIFDFIPYFVILSVNEAPTINTHPITHNPPHNIKNLQLFCNPCEADHQMHEKTTKCGIQRVPLGIIGQYINEKIKLSSIKNQQANKNQVNYWFPDLFVDYGLTRTTNSSQVFNPHSQTKLFDSSCLFVFVIAAMGWGITTLLKFMDTSLNIQLSPYSLASIRIRAVEIFMSAITFVKAVQTIGMPGTMLVKCCCTCLSMLLKTKDNGKNWSINQLLATIFTFIFSAACFISFTGYERQQKIYGCFLILISILIDRYLPHFQFEIGKQEQYDRYNIKTVTTSRKQISQLQTYTETFKIVTIICVIYLILGARLDAFIFMVNHQSFFVQLVLFGFLGSISQIMFFTLRKQQIPEYLMTTIVCSTDLIACVLSMIFFSWHLHWLQGISVFSIIFALVYTYKQQQNNYRCLQTLNFKKKYRISLFEESIYHPEQTLAENKSKSILGVEVDLTSETILDKEWRERYDICKMVEQVYPPAGLVNYLGKLDDDIHGGWVIEQYNNEYHSYSTKQKSLFNSGSTDVSKQCMDQFEDEFGEYQQETAACRKLQEVNI